MKVTTVILAIGVGLIFGLALDRAATENAKKLVYNVCNDARLEVSGDSEEACGQVQDKYNIEFLCESNNWLASTHCWTEAK